MLAEYYKNFIVLLLILVPYLVFIRGTYIDRNRATLNRALIAIGVGWVLVIVSSAIIMGVDYLFIATEFEKQQIISDVSDRLMFAAMLGWVFPALVIFFAWLIHLGINRIRRRWFPHLVFKRF